VRAGAAAIAGRRARLAAPLPALSANLRRRLLILLLAGLALAAGYQFWLRDSPLFGVDEVSVTGLTTKDSERVRAALTTAAHSMTTLHVDRERLEQAVAIYPVVRELRVSADFPHGLQIHVLEHRPAAIADIGHEEVAVAADGTVLRGLPVEGRLPSIETGKGVKQDRLLGAAALAAARVAGAAPGPLRGRLDRIASRGDEGIVVELRDGPELIFGDASGVRAKWLAAARVLSDPDAAGATYIDLRLPGRPAAGGLPAETVAPVAPAGDPTLGAVGADPGAAAPTDSPAVIPPADPGLTATTPETTAPPASTAPAPVTPTAPPSAPADGTGTGAVTAP
jgi:cell division protein FtsQ